MQELVQIGVDFCFADSAGVSLEEVNEEADMPNSFMLLSNGARFKDLIARS